MKVKHGIAWPPEPTAKLQKGKTQSIIGGSSKPPKVRKVGKKLSANRRKPDFPRGSMRWLFCMRLRELTQGRDVSELAKLIDVSPDLMRKYIGGTRVPDVDDFPKIAKALGAPDWTDLFRPKNS